MYYVYEWFIVETGEVIYVGKGTGRRYKVRKHNRFFNDMIARFKCDSRIVHYFGIESDAFKFEHDHIAELKKAGQCVCNIYDGGLGGTTSWWTDEKRAYYATHNAMKSAAQRDRMSKNNPMKNPEVAKAVAAQKTRAVIIGEKKYRSVVEACKAFKTSSGTIKKWCTKGINPMGQKCRYKDSPQIEFTGTRYNKGGCKAIVYKGKRYESAVDLGNELGVSNTTVSKWVKKGFSPDGTPCRYEDDDRELTFVKSMPGERNRKAVIVNGTWYSSIRSAEDALGLHRGRLTPYLRGERKNQEFICEYANQQPSQENSDNSILEGSTTNG